METPLALPIEAPDDRADKFRWFAAGSCVFEEDGECRVFVWGTLIGRYRIADRDLGPRNAVLLALAQDRRIHRGRLGQAFGVTDEQIRRLVKQSEEEGLARVVTSKRGGSEGKTPPAVQKKLWRAFDEGMKAREAYERIGRRHGLSLSTVKRQRWGWEEEKERAATATKSDRPVASAAASTPAAETFDAAVAESLLLFATPLLPDASAPASGPEVETLVDEQMQRVAEEHHAQSGSPFEEGEDTAEELRVQHGTPVRGGQIQHLGAWLMLAMAQQFGLYEVRRRWEASGRADRVPTPCASRSTRS